MSKKASHCDQCTHATLKWYVYRGGEPFDVLICDYHHKPRFYRQRHDNPLDDSYGWKKVCADFEAPNAPHEGPGAASSRTVPLDAVVGPRGSERNER